MADHASDLGAWICWSRAVSVRVHEARVCCVGSGIGVGVADRLSWMKHAARAVLFFLKLKEASHFEGGLRSLVGG